MNAKTKMNIIRIIAMLLCMLVLVSSMPVTVLAAGIEDIIENQSKAQTSSPSVGSTPSAGSGSGASNPVTSTPPDQQVVVDGTEGKVFIFTDYGSLPSDNTQTVETYKSVSGEGTLVVEFSGSFTELVVTGDINVGALTVTGNGTLTVGGNIIVTGDISSTNATVNVTGNTTVRGNMSVSGGAWSGGNVEVGGDKITLTNTAASNMTFFGFADSATGDKKLILSSATFNGIETVGVRPANTAVTLDLEVTGGEYTLVNSALIRDHRIQYKEIDGTDIEPQITWPVAYRVKNNGTEAGKSFIVNGEEAQTFVLPTADKVIGYEFGGWKKSADASAEPITSLALSDIGVVSALYVNLTPHEVTITWELGYTPDSYTNDENDPAFSCTPVIKLADETLELPTPFRFGYEFAGWQVILNGTPDGAPHKTSMTIEPRYLTEGASAGSALLNLKAVWTPLKFPLKFQLGNLPSGYTVNDVQMKSADGEWQSVADFVSAHGGSLSGEVMQFPDAEYGTTLAQYFDSIAPGILMRTSDAALVFSVWTLQMVPRDMEDKIALGSLYSAAPAGTSLRVYQEELYTTAMPTLVTSWVENRSDMEFSDKLYWNDSKDSNIIWYIYVNGVDRTAEIKKATSTVASNLKDIPVNADVSFRVLSSSEHKNASFTLWKVTSDGQRVKITESVIGDYRCYTFKMPDTDVFAAFNNDIEDVTFNMKESPVSEQKIGEVYGVWTNELLDHLTPRYDTLGNLGYAPNSELAGIDLADGWSNGAVLHTEMQYFYELPLNHYYYLTTNDAHIDQTKTIEEGNGTWNQWRGGHRENIYLKDCHLWATTEYSKEALQDYIDAATEKTYFNDGRMPQISNLYIYLTDVPPSDGCYDQIFDGNNNIVGCIGVESYGQKLSGVDNTMPDIRVGARITNNNTNKQWHPPLGNFYPYEHTTYKDNFGYWNFGGYYTHGWGNSNVYLPHKIMSFSQSYNLNGGFFHVRAINLWNVQRGATLIVEDGFFGSYDIQGVLEGGTLVVRGNIDYTGTISVTNGTLIVLGDVLRSYRLDIDSTSTVIANAIETQALNSSGTILANSIRNLSVKFENNYQTVNSNGDARDYIGYIHKTPTYVNNENNAHISYQFAGGNVYLLGYQTAATSGTGMLSDTNNPLYYYNAVMPPSPTLDENGYPELQTSALYLNVLNELKANVHTKGMELYEANKAVNADSECFYLGQSANDNRKFAFSGANIYAAGRLTMNNGATISGGAIYTSALSSKWDLFITGGTVEAKEIGNAAAVLVTNLDSTQRYAKTEITGGNIKADRIGALSASTASENRSALPTLMPSTLTSYTAGTTIQLLHDVWVFYSYKADKFTLTDADSFTIRITASYASAKTLTEQAWSLVEPEQVRSFAALTLTAGGTGVAKWSLSQTEGIFVTTFDESGNLLDGSTVTAAVAGREGVVLYAIEVSKIPCLFSKITE